jgi:hypothetical protein
MFGDGNGFVAMLHFPTARERQYVPTLTNFIRAETVISLSNAPNTWGAEPDVLRHVSPNYARASRQVLTSYIGAERAATNVMQAGYPFHLIRRE